MEFPFKNQEQIEILSTYLGEYAKYFNFVNIDPDADARFDSGDYVKLCDNDETDSTVEVYLSLTYQQIKLMVFIMEENLVLDQTPLSDPDGIDRIRRRVAHLIDAIVADRKEDEKE